MTAVRTSHRADSAAETPRSAVRFEGVGKSFGSAEILANIDVDIAPRDIVAVLGASGSGKSTLLRLAAGLDTPGAGRVTIGGTQVRGIDSRSAVVFQEPRLLPWRSVSRNVSLGLRKGQAGGRERVEELLGLVGLEGKGELRPRQISGGMASRTSLARALAREPELLLLDEPFGALDALTRLRMQDLLLEVHAARPTTVLFVTHDVDEALRLATHIVVLGAPAPGAPATVLRRETTGPDGLRESLLATLGVGGPANLVNGSARAIAPDDTIPPDTVASETAASDTVEDKK